VADGSITIARRARTSPYREILRRGSRSRKNRRATRHCSRPRMRTERSAKPTLQPKRATTTEQSARTSSSAKRHVARSLWPGRPDGFTRSRLTILGGSRGSGDALFLGERQTKDRLRVNLRTAWRYFRARAKARHLMYRSHSIRRRHPPWVFAYYRS
jgi:hypothetical protein